VYLIELHTCDNVVGKMHSSYRKPISSNKLSCTVLAHESTNSSVRSFRCISEAGIVIAGPGPDSNTMSNTEIPAKVQSCLDGSEQISLRKLRGTFAITLHHTSAGATLPATIAVRRYPSAQQTYTTAQESRSCGRRHKSRTRGGHGQWVKRR
jgi:hypothetical protein